MSNFEACQEQLLAYSQRRGYLTFDDILDAASTFSLSLSEIDRISDNLQSLGVMLLESAPTPKTEDTSELVDYTRTDYDEIFSEILSLSETLEPLIDTIKEIPPPQYREVQTLTGQLQYGNLFARERLILLHLRVAAKIALSIAKQYSYPIEDAISASFIGLVEAVEHFDPNGFSAFLSYASMWIQQNIHRYCTPTWMEYYCPTHFREKLFPAILKYTSNSGTIINEDEFDPQIIYNIATELGIEEQTVVEYLLFAYNQANNHINSDVLWHPADDYEENLSAELEEQTQTNEDWLFDIAAQKELSCILPTIISTLTPREELILRMRFGLYDGIPKTLEEVGQQFDITKERVRQIEKKCIRQLRHPSRAKRIKDFYY